MITPDQFLHIVRSEDSGDQVCALGTIPGTYTGGRPTIVFDGEATASTKTYPYLSSYTPAANDRVLLLRVGHTWTILGKVI